MEIKLFLIVIVMKITTGAINLVAKAYNYKTIQSTTSKFIRNYPVVDDEWNPDKSLTVVKAFFHFCTLSILSRKRFSWAVNAVA